MSIDPPPAPARRRYPIVIGVVVAVFVVAAVVVGTVLNNADPSSKTAASASRSTPVPTATAGQVPTSPAPFAAAPPSAGKRTTTEVEAGSGAAVKGLPLSSSSSAAQLFTGPIPKSGSATGSLVKGFPSTIPVATGSKVTTSSISSSDGIMQVTLVARTTAKPSAVSAYYTAAFAKLGISPSTVAAADGSEAYSFVRNNDSVTITVTSAAGGSRYSVFGVLHAAS
jgi:hypothetical protein